MANSQLHVHGRQSANDSAVEYDELIKRAKEMNATAIALSDHGTMTGVYPFLTAMEGTDIKPIIGCEFYYQEDNSLQKNAHLIIYALDNIGFKVMGKALTEANKRIDAYGAPRLNKEIMEKYFGEGSEGHGHVIATTACMQGYVNIVLNLKTTLQKKLDKVLAKKATLKNPGDATYMEMCEALPEIDNQLAELRTKKANLDRISKKSLVKKEKKISTTTDEKEVEALTKQLNIEKAEIKEAKKQKDVVTLEISNLSSKKSELNKNIKKLESEFDKYIKLEDEENKIREEMAQDLEVLAEEEMHYLINLFGKDNLYAELQYHRIDAEAYCMPILAKLAKKNGLKFCAANDVHFVRNSKEEMRKRQILRSLRFNKFSEDHDGDSELYMKTDEELRAILSEILPEDIIDEAFKGNEEIVERCNFKLVKTDHYPKYKSEIIGETANEAIRRLSYDNIEWRYPDKKGWTKEHEERLEYELKIICSMGYADYHLIVQDFLNIGRKMGHMPAERFDYLTKHIDEMSLDEMVKYIEEDQSEVGLFIGPGRGSAVGSLVCYLLGITSIDPLKYDLLFERFLNPERVSMPDIDSDFASECRGYVLEYVKKKYGHNAVCCIATRGTHAVKSSIRDCARILAHELYGDITVFYDLADQIAKDVPTSPGMSFSTGLYYLYDGKKVEDLDKLKTLEGFDSSKLSEVTLLQRLLFKYKDNKNAIKIINDAKLIENTFSNYGMHAAGVIISDNSDISDYIPLMWDSTNNVWKSQCDMIESEANGLLKMDFLGLNNLSIITATLRLIRQRTGIKIDIERDIDIDPDVLKNIYCKAMTNSIFQFESGGMKSMLKKFQPDSIDDILLLNAAYRPGPMQYLDKIVNVKHGIEPMSFLVPELEHILNKTYGSIIYQEEVMQICQDLAGYSLGGADMVRRYMSKKKVAKLAHEREVFVYGNSKEVEKAKAEGKDLALIPGCVANGIDADKANELFDQMMDFARYAFNKSHACAYAYVSYYTAWLKHYYPTEYLCSVLNNVPLEKVPGLIDDCKKFGINVLAPDINKSGTEFTICDDDILFGLNSIKTVGVSAFPIIEERKNKGKFVSLKDFISRGHVKKNATEALIGAGALDGFGDNRYAMLKVLPDLLAYHKIINEKVNKIDEKTNELKEFMSKNDTEEKRATKAYIKKINSLNRSIMLATKAYEASKNSFSSIMVPNLSESKKERLEKEKELIGMYVSGHPLDEYPDSTELGTVSVSDLMISKNIAIAGIIKNLKVTARKSDGAPMAFFTIEDKTGDVDINCFVDDYKKYGDKLKEDVVVRISGRCDEQADFFDETEFVKKVTAKKIDVLKPKKQHLLIFAKSIEDWCDNVNPILEDYKDNSGCISDVHFYDTNTFQRIAFKLSEDILNNSNGIKVKIK